MYETGRTEDNPDAKGLVFLIHPKDYVTNSETYSNTAIQMKVNL